VSEPAKPDYADYPRWLREVADITIDQHTRRQFNANAAAAQSGCQAHPFFKSLDRTLGAMAEEYGALHGPRLFLQEEPRLALKLKSYDSTVNKSYRLNVLRNANFPEPPRGGWLGPDRWFATIDDIVRSQLVCRYLDGPGFVVERLEQAAAAAGLICKHDSVQHDRGYYAFHFYVTVPVDMYADTVPVTVEIQLTTQLQDVVYGLTHGFYEEIRLMERAEQNRDAWKWEYTTARFKAGYLSHTLHLLEGLIAEVRRERFAAVAKEQHDDGAKEPEAADAAGAVPPGDSEAGPGR
jgi:ppGpp synthetase/RelA/SpoT-type nucleotidyltranferase